MRDLSNAKGYFLTRQTQNWEDAVCRPFSRMGVSDSVGRLPDRKLSGPARVRRDLRF